MPIDPDVLKVLYSENTSLFTHYSSRIYAARAAIVTLAVAGGTWVFGISEVPGSDVARIAPSELAYSLALLIGLGWLMELGYFLKFNYIARTIMGIEMQLDPSVTIDDSYFQRFRPFTHKAVYGFYLIAAIFLGYRAATGDPSPNVVMWAVIGLTYTAAFAFVFSVTGVWGRSLGQRLGVLLLGRKY